MSYSIRFINSRLFLFLTLLAPVFLLQQQVPAELQGKWKLLVPNTKLVGSIDIKNDGKYSYLVSPNYREAGFLQLNPRTRPAQINMLLKNSRGHTDTTRGIYKIVQGKLNLCLGRINGLRPTEFRNDPKQSITLWNGSK